MARRRRLFWHLYRTYLLIVVLSALGVGVLASQFARSLSVRQAANRLESVARVVVGDLPNHAPDFDPDRVDALCKRWARAGGVRVTVILLSGAVAGDSGSEPVTPEPHHDRPEVIEALETGYGQSVRRSATMDLDLMYVAVPLLRGGEVVGVVRTAVPVERVKQAVGGVYARVALGALPAAAVAALVALWEARRLALPLKEMAEGAHRFARGEFDHKVLLPETRELGQLAATLNRMAGQLKSKYEALLRQAGESQAVLSSMTEGVLAVNRVGHVLSLNRAAETMLAVRAEQALGRSLEEVVRNVGLGRLVERILEGERPAEAEIVLRQQHEDRVIQVHGTVLRDAAGREMGGLLVLNDVSRLHRLATVRRDFVANVSHELKTPITSIRGFVETLRDGAIHDTAKAERFLEIVARHAERLDAIIEDLLALSRIEREDEVGRIERTPVDLRTVLDEAAADCAGRAAARGVTIETSCPGSLRTWGNARLMRQAVTNLLDNAIKYSESGRPVHLAAERNGDEIRISVADQGCGIAPEHHSRIFERFYRVDKGRSRMLGGTGLGLAIVKHIAQAHGGSVSLASAVGQGSTFTIHLPRETWIEASEPC